MLLFASIVAVVVLLTALLAGVALMRRGRSRMGVVVLVVPLVLALVAGGYVWSLDRRLDSINRAPTDSLSQGERPSSGASGKALTVLLLGSDDPAPSAEKPTVAELLEADEWQAGAYRSDTIMLLHIPADRRDLSFVSIPRDSYVDLRDPAGSPLGRNKINAAFAQGGPLATWRTVETLSDVRIDHMAIVDFTGFKTLTEELEGVDVYVPETIRDPKQDQTWTQGWHHVEGDLALKYVRMRYGLDEGDFDRVARQQNFIRALLSKMTSVDTLANPLRLSGSLEAAAESLTVDQEWSKGAIRQLALSLRNVSMDDSQFLTLPLDRYDSVAGVGSVNVIDTAAASDLWRALRRGNLKAYAEAHPEDVLNPPTQVD